VPNVRRTCQPVLFEGELDCATRIRAAGSVKAYVNRCKTGAADVDVIHERVAHSAPGCHAPGVLPSHHYDLCQAKSRPL